MTQPVCSVVVPAYNVADVITQALDSLLDRQTDRPFEIIVVNDGSTDATVEVVRSYGARVQLLEQPNLGPASARNHGVLAARSELILFLDADDRTLPGRIERQVDFMSTNPDIDICFGNWLVEGDDGDYLAGYGLAGPLAGFAGVADPLQRLLVRGSFVPTSTVAIRRRCYIANGMQPVERRYAEDYALWCRIAGSGGRFAFTGTPLSWYRRARPGRLTYSPHTYAGPVEVMRDTLLRYGSLLSREDHAVALDRYRGLMEVLLRHDWAYGGRDQVLARLETLKPFVSPATRRKWSLLAVVPSALPRSGRAVLHWMRRLRSPTAASQVR
jgi:glycosyltransferase involved in cell wall biosynthesis